MLPSDPIILLSVVNTRLRDKYASLEILCEDCGADENELKAKLRSAGFEYDKEKNRFI